MLINFRPCGACICFVRDPAVNLRMPEFPQSFGARSWEMLLPLHHFAVFFLPPQKAFTHRLSLRASLAHSGLVASSICNAVVCVCGLCVYSLQKHTRHKTPPHPLPPQQKKPPPPTKRNKQHELTNSTRALCERPGLCCAAAVDSQALATSRGAP